MNNGDQPPSGDGEPTAPDASPQPVIQTVQQCELCLQAVTLRLVVAVIGVAAVADLHLEALVRTLVRRPVHIHRRHAQGQIHDPGPDIMERTCRGRIDVHAEVDSRLGARVGPEVLDIDRDRR